jgi:branched-chain amino acid transport system substrate-binding protein
MTRFHRKAAVVLAATVTGFPLALAATATAPSPAGASGAPITIAYVTDLTGEGGSENGSSPAGFEARIALQNAEGGVNGHKLVPLVIDDQTNPSEIATAVQEADSKAFGIVSQSPLFFLAAKYPNQAGVPVTGTYDDGPEWGTQPYTNMFASDEGSVNPKYPVNTEIGNFLKAHGGTVLGSYGYMISPSSSRAATGTAESFQHAGGKVGVLDTTVPFGSVDFTSEALVAKQKGVNTMVPAMDANSNYALAEALEQAGVKLKATLYATGYEPDAIHSPAWPDLQGAYFLTPFRPWSLPNAGTQQMQAAMEKYAHFTKTQFPTFGQYEAWAGADLMIKGLLLAGKNPTQAAVIKDLRGIKSYNANGLLPNPINYSTIFGHDPAQTCAWVMQANKTGFKAISSQPTCGTDIPGTSTAGTS